VNLLSKSLLFDKEKLYASYNKMYPDQGKSMSQSLPVGEAWRILRQKGVCQFPEFPVKVWSFMSLDEIRKSVLFDFSNTKTLADCVRGFNLE
jgi:hypothetical protein